MIKLLKIFFCRHEYVLEEIIPEKDDVTGVGIFRCEKCGKIIKDQF